MIRLKSLFEELKQTPEGHLFNPWYRPDPHHDLSEEGPEIRKTQLYHYLKDRMNSAKYICIAEALGYQGGHFSGIAMTSERILLGHHEKVHGIPPGGVFSTLTPRRTSKPEVNAKGMTEPTATIMWKAIYNLGIDPFEIILWNALAWHPFDPDKGLLSNRTPTNAELKAGLPALEAFLALFSNLVIIAVGKKSARCLDDFGLNYREVRHPANGGAPKFRRQFKQIIQDTL